MHRVRDLIKETREAHGLSKVQAARITHFDRNAVWDFESGRRTTGIIAYAVALVGATHDRDLPGKLVHELLGVPLAGLPMPDTDRHPLSFRLLMDRKVRQALEELDTQDWWRQGDAQHQGAERLARRLWHVMVTSRWAFDSVCDRFEIDGHEIMKERTEIFGMPRRVVSV